MKTSRELHASIVAHCESILDRELVTLIADRTCGLLHEMRQAADNDNSSLYSGLMDQLRLLEALVGAHVVVTQSLVDTLNH